MGKGWDLAIIAFVFLVLFGTAKLPQMARSLGQSARIFKSEIKGMQADDEARSKATEPQAALQPAPVTNLAAPAPAPAPAQTPAAEGSSGSDTSR